MIFEVYGKPQGKGRPRFFRGHAVTPKETKDYERRIAVAYRAAGGRCITDDDKTPVRISVTMVFEPNKSDTKKTREKKLSGKICPTVKPDNDNCLKVVEDALQGGIAFHDDKQIVQTIVTKVYGEEAKLIIDIDRVEVDKDGRGKTVLDCQGI